MKTLEARIEALENAARQRGELEQTVVEIWRTDTDGTSRLDSAIVRNAGAAEWRPATPVELENLKMKVRN
jgi:hypothetical protein